MSLEDFAADVPSVVEDNGSEFLSSIGIDPASVSDFSGAPISDLNNVDAWAQNGSFAGDANWYDAFGTGGITDAAKPIGGFDLGEFAGVDEAIANQTTAASGSILDKAVGLAESGYKSVSENISKLASDAVTKITDPKTYSDLYQKAATEVSKLATDVVKKVTDPKMYTDIAKSVATSAVKQGAAAVVSSKLGTGALAQSVNKSINTTINSVTASSSGTPAAKTATGNAEAKTPDPVGYDVVENKDNGTYSVVNSTTGKVAESGLTLDAAISSSQQLTDAASGEQPPAATPGDTKVTSADTPVNNTDSYGLTILNKQQTEALVAANVNPALINGLQPVQTGTTPAAGTNGVNGATINASPAAVTDPIADQLRAIGQSTVQDVAGPTEQDVLAAIAREDAARTQALVQQAQQQQTIRAQRQNKAQATDWRVRLRLAPNSNYLYNAPNPGPILQPLKVTDGVIFPYTPQIDTAYRANYQQYDLTHSNYRGYFYQNSYVDAINIRAIFTAQDTSEADYRLGVIHFFRSATKMFYGQDDAAKRGAPPPLVYLSGLGEFQFNEHPCLIQQFNYSMPAEVDYIRAQSTLIDGQNLITKRDRQNVPTNPLSYALQRLASVGLTKGAMDMRPVANAISGQTNATYVPTKMEISLTLLPTQSRSQVSDQFSVENFANGNLLKGGFW